MKRYLAFAGSIYYPSGGMNDFIGEFEDLEMAAISAQKEGSENHSYFWYQVYDTITKTIVVDEDSRP